MKFAIVQIVRPNQAIYYLTHDPFRTILYSLESLGHDVICLKNQLARDRINILTTAYNISEMMALELQQKKINYIVYQTEVLTDHGINATIDANGNLYTLGNKQRLKLYLQVLANARMIWDCFRFNQKYLRSKGIESSIIRHGYHPNLEGAPKKQNLDIDLLFFGSMSNYRRKILQHLHIKKFNVQVLTLEPPFYRDDFLRRTKINLSIRTDHRFMSHLPHFRVLTALYHHTLTVSEKCNEQEWMKDLVMMVDPKDLVNTCAELLRTGEWQERAKVCREHFLQLPMTDYLEHLVIELDEKLKNQEYALQKP